MRASAFAARARAAHDQVGDQRQIAQLQQFQAQALTVQPRFQAGTQRTDERGRAL
ncbi:hypothetical protein D9M69_692610 [compost metagenome]